MWFIFEGLDKAGKTTLEWELLKETNFKHIIIDRGPAGYMTFDKIFNRDTVEGDSEFTRQAKECMTNNSFKIIYCYCDKSTADKRLKIHNETCPYDYLKAQELYLSNIMKCYKEKNTLLLDTTEKSVEECIKIIYENFMEV